MRALLHGGMKLLAYLSVAVAIAATLVVFVEYHEAEQYAARQREQATQASEQRVPFEQAFASGDPQRMLQHCRDAVQQRLGYAPWVVGLAFGPQRIDAFYYRSTRVDSVHRYTCTPDGIAEARVEHPLAAAVRAMHEEQLEPADYQQVPELWSQLSARLAAQQDAAPFERIELLLAADQRGTVERTTAHGGEVRTAPADAPPFPRLYDDGSAALERDDTVLRQRPYTRWSSSSGAAFALLAGELPAGARIVEMRLDDDAIEVSVAGPLPGLDAPYGDIDFDNWSEIETWLYPRETAGFGCSQGEPLDVVRQRFDDACSALPGCNPATHFSIADYSCSRGATDGRWTLRVQSLNEGG